MRRRVNQTPGTPPEQFITSVREALGRKAGPPEHPYSRMQETGDSVAERGRATLERLSANRRTNVEELARVAELRGWMVHRASGVEDAVGYVCRLAEKQEAKRVVRSAEGVFDDVPMDDALSALGASVQVMAREHESDGTFNPADADLGVTGVDYAIAETGSVVILPRRGVSRLTSLLPPVHVALVKPSQTLESLDDLYLLRRLAYLRDGADAGAYMNFITGPSRTADIEQTLVIGAHGPRETHMVILDWGDGDDS